MMHWIQCYWLAMRIGDRLKQDLKSLKETDIYSLVLFALYQITDNPKYSTLSELAYVLNNKDSLYNLLDYFGGVTLRIPTKQELQVVINALLIYQYVKIDKITFSVAINKIGDMTPQQLNEVRDVYNKLCERMDRYYTINE